MASWGLRSPRCPVPLLLILFLLSISCVDVSSASVPRLCAVVNYHSATAPGPVDGLATPTTAATSWNDLAWARDACARNAGASFTFADSDWQSQPSLRISTDLAQLQGLASSNGRVRRSVTARLSADGARLELLNITIAFRLTLAKPGFASVSELSGVVTKSIVGGGGLPLEAAASLPVGWYGALQKPIGAAAGSLALYDADLFDGTLPAAVVSGDAISDELLEVAATVREAAGSPALRQVLFDTTPSALTDATLRGAFLNASSLAPVTAADAVDGQVWRSASAAASTGLVLQSRAECRGASCAGLPFVAALGQIVNASIHRQGDADLCASPAVVVDSLRAWLSVDLAAVYSPTAGADLTQASVRVRGMSARSEALFRCAGAHNGSFIGIALSVTAPLSDSVADWPLSALTDQRTSVGLLRAIPLATHGWMAGSVLRATEKNGTAGPTAELFTVAPGDLFGSDGGGLLLADRALSVSALKADATAVFAVVQRRLATDVAPIEARLADLFPSEPAAVSAAVEAYAAQTLQPTWLGFLAYHARRHQHQLFVSPDGQLATLSVDFGLPPTQLTADSDNTTTAATIVAQANRALDALGSAVKAKYGGITNSYVVPTVSSDLSNAKASLAGFFTGAVTINCSTSAVAVVVAPQYSAVASIKADFAGVSSALFTAADITYDFSSAAGAASTISATPASALQGAMGGTVGLTLEGQLAVDGPWANVPALGPQLQTIANGVAEVPWARGVVRPFVDVDFGRMSASTRLADMISALGTNITANVAPAVRGWALAQRMKADIEAHAAGDATVVVHAHVVPLVGASQTMDVSLVVHSQRRVQLSSAGTTWDSIADTVRLAIPLALTTRLRFSVSASAATGVSFGVRGGGRLTGSWAIPFTYQMLSGAVTNGSAVIDVSLPGGGAMLSLGLDVAASQPTVRNATNSKNQESLALRAEISDDDLVDQLVPAVLVVTQAADGSDATMGTRTISPSRLVSALGEALLPALTQAFTGALNIAVPPLKKPLGSITQFNDLVKAVKPWLTTAADPTLGAARLVQSATFCTATGAPTPLAFNVSINDFDPVRCEAAAPLAPASVDALRADIATMLAGCGLAGYLEAQVIDVERVVTPNESDRQCGHVGLFPAVPGIVWNFAIATDPMPLTANITFGTATYISTPKPAFATWTDLARLLAAVLTHDDADPANAALVAVPEWTTAEASVVVPPELAAYYPPRLPAVAIRVEAQHTAVDHQFELDAQMSTADGVLQLQSHTDVGTGTVRSSLSAALVTVFGAPPLGGRGNISLSTNYDGVNTTANATLVPAAPDNTFALIMGAQVLSTSAPPANVGARQLITLPPGKLLSAALIDDVVPQVDPALRPMLAVYEMPSDGLIYPVTQIRFDLGPHQLADGRWAVPTAFGLEATSQLPALTNASNVPSQSVVLARDVAMRLATRVETVGALLDGRSSRRAAPTAEGRIAILGFTSGQHAALSQVEVEVKGVGRYQTMAELYPPRETFFDQFAVGVALNNSAAVGGLQMTDLQRVDTDLPDVRFAQEGRWAVDSLDALKALTTRALTSWTAEFNGTAQAVDTFRSLLHTNDSICTWMGLASNVSQAIVMAKAAGVRLPFSQHGFGSLLSDSLASSLAELHTSVCVNHEPFSLGTYCRVARGAFGGTTTACANATLSDAGLTVDLIVVPFNRSYVDQLRFDTSSLFNNAQVPVGLGASGDLSLLGEFDFRMRLLARFGGDEGGVSFGLDPAGTYFSARAGFDVQGTLRFYFGPVSLNLLTAHAWLGNPATLIFRLQPTSAADVTALEFVSAEESSSSTELVTVDTWSSPSEVGALMDTKGRLEISGNAGFTAVVGFSTSVQCSIDVGVPDLGAFLAGGQRPSVSQRGCGQGFAQELLKSLLKQSLLDYFSSRFLAQWESGFAQFLGRLFGHAGPLRAGGPVVPLIDKLITALMTDSIGRMSGADAMNRLTTAINGITTSLLHRNTTADMQKLDQLVLTLITKALCRELAPVLVECPAVPDVTSSEYVWPLHFRGTNSRPLARLGFRLGGHGFAGLDLKCAGAVVMEWDLQFVMAFNRTHGLDFRFDAPEVFTGDIALEVVGGCGLSGTIGWIGADLSIAQPKLLEGRLTVDPRFQVDLAVRAQIYGKAELGLGGKLAERLAHAPDALDALPHWQATLNLTWGWDLRAPNQALVPKFALTDIRFCVGRLLSHVVSSTVSQTVDRLLRPLEPVLGPNGLLLRPIPGLSDVFGHDLNMIQLLIYACRVNGECQLNGVVDALRTFVDVYHKLDTVRQIAAALEGDGCNVVQLVRDFIVDFNTPVPIPIYDGAIPPGGLQFSGATDANPQLKHTVSAFYSGVVTSGHFGVRLYMFDNIGQNLVSAMLGQDFPLAGVTLPDVTFFVSKEWWIPVWVFPRVDLVLGVNARFTLSFGGVALMYSGLADAYKTGSPGALFGALALPTRNDDGSERWPVQAAIGFKGGVGVSIFIFRGEVYLTIALEGDAAFVDVDQDGWVTFNEIAYLVRLNGLKGAVRLRLVLRAGFGIKIQACIRLLWKRKCWTLFNKHWDRSWPLYDNSRRLFDSIAAASGSQSSVNIGMVSFNPQTGHSALGYDGDDGDGDGGYYNGHGVISDDDDGTMMMTMNTTMMTMMKPLAEMRAADQTDLTYSIYQTPEGLTVDFAPMGVGVGSGTPHLSRAGLPSGQTIAAYGNPGATPFTWAVGYVAQTVAMPAYATATLRFLVSEYPGVSAMTVSPQVVSPDTAPGVTVSTCALLHVAQPTTGVAYGVWGVPCATLLESMVTNNVSLAGAAAAYPHPLTLSGEAWAVSSTITATQLTVASGSLSAVDGPSAAQVTLPAAYQVLTVSGDLQRPATYTLADVRAGVTASVTGGVADDLFVVQGMHLLHGSTTIAGGAGVDASEVTIVTDAGVELDVTVTPAWLVVENALGVANTLRHSSVERRTYLVHGAPNTRSRVTLLAPERDDSVVIVAHGAPGSTIAQQITGCDGKSEVRYSFRDGGDHELRIGNNQRVTDMRCTVWLDAIPPGGAGGQTVSVIIEASAETRPLQYDVQENAILIYDVEGDGSFFHLMFDQIQRVQIQFGVGGTVLRMAEGTTGTEFFFDFVDTNATTVNEARIAATNSPVLLAGHLTTVDVGPAQTAIVSVDPLQDILAPVAIAQPAAQLPSALVRLASGTGPRAPVQHYYLDSACLAARDRSSSSGAPSPVHVGTKPSAWLCGLMTQHGLPAAACADPCPVIYTGPINVTIATGWADDSFYAADVVAASVAVSLGPGADNVTWLAVPASAGVDRVTARFDLGPGSDQLLLASPVRNVTVLLGDDTDVDQVAFYSGGLPVPPNINGNVVAPVGPNGAALTLEQVHLQDLLFVYGGNPSGPLGGGVVAVDDNATSSLPGGHRLGDDRPVVTINVTVQSQVVSMDARSGFIYHVVGSAQSATVSLNGLGRPQPPFPTAVDWDLLVDVPPSVGLSVTMLAESGSRSKATIDIVDQSPGPSVQSVDIRSSVPDGLCTTVVGLLEVRTRSVDHLKIDARRPIAARVAGTAYADLVIVTPDAPAAGSPASSVYLASVENTTLVVNATLTIAGPALLASRAIVATGQRAQLTFDGYAFGSGGASFVDGCLLGAGLSAPSTPFSSWFAGEAAAALGSATAAAAAQTCSFYGLRLASVNLTTPALSLGGLGADRAVRRVNLLQVPAAVTLDDDLQPWARTTIATAALAVDDRFVLDLTAAGGIVTVASPVFGPANASALDVFVSENAETPYCRWLLGAPDNATATNGTAVSGATLLMQDARQRVTLYGSSLVSPRHMPRVLLHGPLAVAALLHNATNGTARDVVLNPASLSVVEALVPIVPPPPPHGNGTTNGTAAFVSALSRRAFDEDVSSELNQQPLLHVEWIIASWQEQGYLRVELADGINSVVFNHTSASAAAAAFQMPTLVVREAAAATLVPPQLGPSRTPSVDLLRTREIKADLSTQFLEALPADVGDDEGYCLQPTEQTDRNSWLWLTVRQAPWLEPYLACRPDAELERCRRDHFVSLDLDHQHHRLRAVLHLTPLKNVVPVSSNHSTNHSTAADAGGNVPFVLFVTAASAAAVHHPMAVGAPTEWDYGLSVLVLFGGMMAIGFGWWVITGSVIPAAWGPFVITAALAGLVESDTTWDPRVVSIVEAAYWMVSSFVSGCHSLSIFHICVLAVFLGLGALGLAALFLRDSWSRLLVPVVRRAVTALAAVAIPFVIAQAPARAGQSVGWSVFTGGLGLCGLFVVASLLFHTFAAIRSRSRRVPAAAPALLLGAVVVGMSILTRLRYDDDEVTHKIIFIAAIVAVAIDSVASLCGMLVLTSLVKGWWRVSPGLISGATMLTSAGCGFAFLFTLNYSAGLLPLVMWYVWALLPTVAAVFVLVLPCPVITKSTSKKGTTEELGLSVAENERPLLHGEEFGRENTGSYVPPPFGSINGGYEGVTGDVDTDVARL